ncbi:MAG: inorganic phosphate transporter [Rikenellaceae bacterium]
MSPIFTFVVITLAVLAIFDIIVGVANDAVNFLNSAIGSKIAPLKVILGVASVGILIGTITSSGMMEVAKSGVFHPGMFTYPEIMMLFLGMIVGDIILLDIFNNLGLPTSTTVSMVFGLLGAAVGISIHRIAVDSGLVLANLGSFINTAKAFEIVAAILLSVALSFIFGLLFMYISRLIFSFRYKKVFSKFGALWCGISFTGMVYFVLFKGLKSSGMIPVEVTNYIEANTVSSLLMIWAASSFVLFLLQMFKVKLLKTTILAGTFSLALAFAGNDLVNFIGVPVAGYESYQIAQQSDDYNNLKMTALQPKGSKMAPATAKSGSASTPNATAPIVAPASSEQTKSPKANTWMLVISGIIMVCTLFFSKKAMNVSKTELSLSNQNEGAEKFSSSELSRGLVRAALAVNNFYIKITPKKIQAAIDKQFEQLPPEERGDATYDLIRATVNLTAASILISIATSMKLPLSTTYVVFMVAMGSSLADKAWGRESAVYRITGVMTVIMGWFLTAIVGFTIAFLTASALIWGTHLWDGGWTVMILVVGLCLFLAIRSNFFPSKNKEEDDDLDRKMNLIASAKGEEILYRCTEEIFETITRINKIYNRTLVALFKENRKVLKEMNQEAQRLSDKASDRKHNILETLHHLQDNNINSGHFYVQVVDYTSEVTKALVYITKPSFAHIDNNHSGLTKEQIFDLMSINDDVEQMFIAMRNMLSSKDFSDLESVMTLRYELFDKIADATKKQLKRIKANEAGNSSRSSMLYLDILNETKTIILQSKNLMKSQNYFLENKD